MLTWILTGPVHVGKCTSRVLFFLRHTYFSFFSAVTAEGTTIAPLITGNIDDRFQINVIDQLTDANMRRATSIASIIF